MLEILCASTICANIGAYIYMHEAYTLLCLLDYCSPVYAVKFRLSFSCICIYV